MLSYIGWKWLRNHLRSAKNSKFCWGGMPPHPPRRCVLCTHILYWYFHICYQWPLHFLFASYTTACLLTDQVERGHLLARLTLCVHSTGIHSQVSTITLLSPWRLVTAEKPFYASFLTMSCMVCYVGVYICMVTVRRVYTAEKHFPASFLATIRMVC